MHAVGRAPGCPACPFLPLQRRSALSHGCEGRDSTWSCIAHSFFVLYALSIRESWL
jgi:hypothetical protein